MASHFRSKSKKLVVQRGIIDTAVTYTAELLTPLWHAQQSHWHHCDMHSCVIDTAVQQTLSKIFTNDPKHYCFYAGIWFGCTRHSGVIDTAVTCTAESLTLLWQMWHAQWSHWHRCDMHSGVIDTAVQIWLCHWHRCANMTLLWLWTSYSSGSGYL
jgi:hypothetical protein